MTVVNFYNIDASSKDIISVDNYKFDTGKEAENWILGEHYDLLMMKICWMKSGKVKNILLKIIV
jgi:hypothetical protein